MRLQYFWCFRKVYMQIKSKMKNELSVFDCCTICRNWMYISNYWLCRLQRFALRGVPTQAIPGSFVNWVIHILHMFAVLTSFDEFIANWERNEKLDFLFSLFFGRGGWKICQGFELWTLSTKAKMPEFVLSKWQLERLDCNYQIWIFLALSPFSSFFWVYLSV